MSIHSKIENVYIRQEAVQLTRHHFWRLLGMAVIIRFIMELLNWALYAVGDGLMLPEIKSVIDQYALLVTSTKMTSAEPMLNAITELFLSPKFILFNLVYMIVTSLVSAGLSLGRNRQLIDTGRGGYPKPLHIFGGMKLCLRAWGLQLWTGLKIGLWSLPGWGVMLVGAELTMYDLEGIGNIVMVIGLVLMLVLSFRALLRYAMAPFLLADEPDRGIRDCARTSTGLMQGRLWQYLKLFIPLVFKFIGAAILANMAFGLIESIFAMGIQTADIVKTVLQFAATVYFLQQTHLARTVYYLHTRRPVTLDGMPKPVSYWLREHTETDIAPDAPETPEAEADVPPENTPETIEAEENDHEELDR